MSAPAPNLKIDVVGLRDFQRALREVDRDFPAQLRVASKQAVDLVVVDTKASFAARQSVAHEVFDAVKGQAEQRGGSVILNGAKAPMIFGAEFGGGAHGPGNPTSGGGYTTQFQPWRGSGPDAGYSLYPTIRKDRDKIVEMYGDAIDKLAAQAFPD